MGKLFGTDGVRGLVLLDLDASLAMKLGASTARVLASNEKKLTFLIASDTRISKDMLKSALISGVLSEGANVIDLGVIPTPAISYLIQKYQADGGFVISASHNPSEYNGIKVFNSNGYKIADELEDNIETLLLDNFQFKREINAVGSLQIAVDAKDEYIEFLKSTIDTNLDFSQLNVVIDTANGASYETAELLFEALNIKYQMINSTPDGYNINDNCGSTHLESLRKKVLEKGFSCGIAFDGDADRCLMIDELGNIIDGDKIMAICGLSLKQNNNLANNTIVGTVMTNLGFVKFCEQENINFVATKVGDRYVLENMLINDYNFGGEQSGHIIFRQYANTGDGQLTAIQILSIMAKTKKTLSQLGSIMQVYPQVLKNVAVSKEGKESYQKNEKINAVIKDAVEQLNQDGRVLVRASGTENLIRVMLEGKDITTITLICDKIVEVIEKELN